MSWRSRAKQVFGLAAVLLLAVLNSGQPSHSSNLLDASRERAPLGPAADATLVEARAFALQLVNLDRGRRGLAQLSEDRLLSLAAQRHAEDMLRRHYFDHHSPEGHGPAERLRAMGGSFGSGLAENLLMIETDRVEVSPERLKSCEREWMDSPDHRANILGRHYRLFGYGIAADPDSGEIYAVQMFAGATRLGRR